ncbi:class I SAM-dependent DNA methyltransferase, partial [Streptococcus oralis]|uniref:class I SAM-dependent DNA methyltransferase n=1 Tax=Streptococcus oralis TaxID=1303 RepID=UPI0013E95C65
TFFDPACGSGNFLTETYISLRRLENEAIKLYMGDSVALDLGQDLVKVKLHQFYGIEINDFAVSVAKTALWIAESQMLEATKDIVFANIDFLPLKSYTNIVEANALTLDWETVVPKDKLDYIIGNPPFLGARLMSANQKEDMLSVFGKLKGAGNLDYVSAWYRKAAELIQDTSVQAAFVSTNSITQGEQVAILWKELMTTMGIIINFAYLPFVWNSEAKEKAKVHCVIVGFSTVEQSDKYLFEANGQREKVSKINGYLSESDHVFIESISKPLASVPQMGIGNQPIDGGYYLFEKEEMANFVKKEPKSATYFRKWYGAQEFINQKPRYCLWLGDASPAELRSMPHALKRVEAVREFRQSSSRKATQKVADIPTRFFVENMPDSDFLIVPKVSSERRRYIPIGFMSKENMASDLVFIVPNATLYDFGILTSNVHMAWMRTVAGRLKSDYRYSAKIVYNNFPWPEVTEAQKDKIAQTAQAILDARALYPNSSLADLYDELTMPVDLRKAHQAN